jgi:hypothetical protein
MYYLSYEPIEQKSLSTRPPARIGLGIVQSDCIAYLPCRICIVLGICERNSSRNTRLKFAHTYRKTGHCPTDALRLFLVRKLDTVVLAWRRA